MAWKRAGGGKIVLTTTIPPNVIATVHVPKIGGAMIVDVGSGTHTFSALD